MTADAAEDRLWQRLDKWLWCARVLKARSACARLATAGAVRINRQPTGKPHARLRPGDVVTLMAGGRVRVLRVLALGDRRGPAPEARLLYDEVSEPDGAAGPGCTLGCTPGCAGDETAAYRPT